MATDLKKPKAKKCAHFRKGTDLPLKSEAELVGVFNGQSVVISNWDSMNHVYYGGNFGKGTLSKSAPIYHIKKGDIPKIILEQQFDNISKLNANIHYSCSKKYSASIKNDWEISCLSVENFLQSSFEVKPLESWQTWKEKNEKNCNKIKFCDKVKDVISLLDFQSAKDYIDMDFCEVVNNILKLRQGLKGTVQKPQCQEEVIVINPSFASSTSDECISNLSPRLEKFPCIAEENLHLSLEEAFFLKFALGCLNIVDNNYMELSTTDLWEKFNSAQSNFLERYVTYHYYRTKGWVMKSGIKFGGDYLAYKDGPAFYHASYLIKVLDKGKKMSWREFIAMNRLVETFNKTLILCTILPTEPLPVHSFPSGLQNYGVREVLTRRWFPSKEKF